MNWFPVLSAVAIVVAAILGINHPGRVVTIQLSIATITLVWLGIGWWKESRLSTGTMRIRSNDFV